MRKERNITFYIEKRIYSREKVKNIYRKGDSETCVYNSKYINKSNKLKKKDLLKEKQS